MFKFIRRNRIASNFNKMVEDNLLSKDELETLQQQVKDGGLDEAYLHKLITDHSEHMKRLNRNNLVEDFKKMVEDNIISENEFEALQQKVKEGSLEDEYLHKLITDHFTHLTKDIIERISSTRRMSPDDEAALFKICENLKVIPNFGKDMIMAKLLWKRENEGIFTLPEIGNPNPIKKLGEVISFVNEAVWQQVKKKKNYVGYAGLSYKFKIADGLHFRIGNVGPKFTESEGLEVQGHGKLIISNKKILFDGEHKSHSITLGRVIDIEPYSDGIRVAKNTGPDDFFMMDAISSEFAVACLMELLKE